MAQESPGTTPPTSTPPTSTPPTSTPPTLKPDAGPGIMDKMKAGAGKVADKIGKNIGSIDEEMKDKLSDDKKEKKGEEKDEDFVKSIMAMLRGLTAEVNLFRDDLIDKGKEKLNDLKENKDVQKGMAGLKEAGSEGLSGLKEVASNVVSMVKGMMPGSGPKAKKGEEEEEGVELTDVNPKKEEEEAEEEVEMSPPESSPSLKDIAMKVVSSLSSLAKGVKAAFSESSPTPAPTEENTQDLDGPKGP